MRPDQSDLGKDLVSAVRNPGERQIKIVSGPYRKEILQLEKRADKYANINGFCTILEMIFLMVFLYA